MSDEKLIVDTSANATGVNIDLGDSVKVKADFTPIIKATPKGFTWLAKLLGGIKSADIERHIRLSEAQTNADVRGIIEGRLVYDSDKKALANTNQGLKAQIIDAIQEEEFNNLIACCIKAAENIKEAKTEKEPSQDFINRWRNEAKLIRSEELQSIWGRLMSEEINNPDSISLRTLDTVKNISRSEAELFMSLVKYLVCKRGFIFFIETTPVDGKTHHLVKPIIKREILRGLYDYGFILYSYSNELVYDYWIEEELEGKIIYYISTFNYKFYVDKIKTKYRPKMFYLPISQFMREIYPIIESVMNNRQENIVEAQDFLKVIKQTLVNCGVECVHYGYIQPDGQVAKYEKLQIEDIN